MSAPDCRYCGLPTPDEWPELCRWKYDGNGDRPCDCDRDGEAQIKAERLATAKIVIGFAIAIALILLGLFAGNARADESGIASFYSHGTRTANGERFDTRALTAAHKKPMPFGAIVRVTNTRNGRSVVVRINDRGPFIAGRIIDLTPAGARAIGMESAGVAPVRLEIVR